MKLKLLKENAFLPARAHSSDSGFDLRCVDSFTIYAGDRLLIKLGFAIELPFGYEAQIRSRSGMALKDGVVVLNGAGTIDAGYRGEIGVILINHDYRVHTYERGSKIAQMIINKIDLSSFDVVDELSESARNVGGFGSTGV